MDSRFAGIDVSKLHLDMALIAADGQRLDRCRLPNTAVGHRQLIARLPVGTHVALEPTASYDRAVARALHEAGFRVRRVNPQRARDFAKSQGRGDKTDGLDALLLARFLIGDTAGVDYVPPTPQRQQLSDLHARLRQIDDMLIAERNRLEHVTDPFIRKSVTAVLRLLSRQKTQVQQHFDRIAAADTVVHRQMMRMRSIPGVGPAVARAVIAELPDLTTFRDASQLAAFVGLAPVLRQSGSSLNRASIPRGGKPLLRATLFLPTLVAIRRNPDVRATYDRLRAKGKSKMSAILAAAHKLIKIIYGVVKHDSPYRPACLSQPT